MLSTVAMGNNVFSDAPSTSYLKAIDAWILGCFTITFTTLTEFVVILYLEKFHEGHEEVSKKIHANRAKMNKGKKVLSRRIEAFFRVIVPILFIFLVIIFCACVGRNYSNVVVSYDQDDLEDHPVHLTILKNELSKKIKDI